MAFSLDARMKPAVFMTESQMPFASGESGAIPAALAVRQESESVSLPRWEPLVRCFPLPSFVALTMVLSWGVWIFLALSAIPHEHRLWKCLYVAGLSGPLV